jgi:hypothetical protein
MQKRERISTLSVKIESPSISAKDSVLVLENVSLDNTILDIKRLILSTCNVPVNHQRLFQANSAQSAGQVELCDDVRLADANIELGWKNPRFNVPGDILELRTHLLLREYCPGGKHWCQSCPVASSSQRESRMSLLLIIFLGCVVVYSVILTSLTS